MGKLSNLVIYTTFADLGLGSSGISMIDIFQKMDAYSYAILDIQSQYVLIDAPSQISGILEIIKNANGRNVARFSRSLSNTTNVTQFWYGVFTWDPNNTKFQGWHEIPDTEDQLHKNPTLQFDLNGKITQLRRSGSDFADLSIIIDNTKFFPLVQGGERSYALLSDLPELTIYSTLIELGFSDKTTMSAIYDKMSNSSYLITTVEGINSVSDLPENDTYGTLEIYKNGRNFARFTPSLSSGSAGSMFYGTFTWSGGTNFAGWRRIIGTDRLANNLTTSVAEYALDARQGKALNDKITSIQSSFQAGVDTLYNKCVSCGSTPSSKTPTAINNAIQSIYTNRYNSGRTQGIRDRVYTIYNSSESSTNHGNLSLTMTSPPSTAYTDREGTYNINITNKLFHKVTIDVISKLSMSFSGEPTCGIELTLRTVEGTTFYQQYIQQHGSDGNNANDGKTYQYTYTMDVMGCKFSTSSDYVILYVDCFFHRNGATINSINLQYTANNIKTYYK